MTPITNAIEQLTSKLAGLSTERLAEVIDFVDFIAERETERELVRVAQSSSEQVLHAIWTNQADAIYDRL